VATSTSYLQTLSQDDAIAFVASLQKVKDHLQSELNWMNQQVQQKTVQLEGIETMLSEAATLSIDRTTAQLNSDYGDDSNHQEVETNSDATEALDPPFEIKDSNGSIASKPKATKAKGAKAPKSTAKTGSSSRRKELRELLLPKFEGKSLTDVVAQVLTQSEAPLHLNQLLTQMYGSLAHQDFKRAKESLANILSVGKKEGKWQNMGGGVYQANVSAIETSKRR